MKKPQTTSLGQSLLHAILSYDETLNEEQGGFILKETGQDNYEFVHVTNEISGKPEATGLYVAHPTEFNGKVLLKTLDDKWDIFASFHTHPRGMRALPSSIDVSKLFTNFHINYIYAPDRELNKFVYEKSEKEGATAGDNWVYFNIIRFYGYNPDTVKARPQRHQEHWSTFQGVAELNES